MPLKDTSLNQVRIEIMDIINRYPDRTGGYVGEYGDKDCVYFQDENGIDVTEQFGEYTEYNPWKLVNPVCIVGQWVHDFHPELKFDEDFQSVLFRNSVLSTSPEAVRVLGEDIRDLLGNIQSQQDGENMTWKDIDF